MYVKICKKPLKLRVDGSCQIISHQPGFPINKGNSFAKGVCLRYNLGRLISLPLSRKSLTCASRHPESL